MSPLTTPAVFLAPDRHAFLVLGTTTSDPAVLTWSRDFNVADDFSRIHGGVVVAVAIVADHSWLGAHPATEDYYQATPDTVLTRMPPAPVEDSHTGWTVGGRDVAPLAGFDYVREAEDSPTAAMTSGDLAEALQAASGVNLPAEVVDELRRIGVPDANTLTRIVDGLRDEDPPADVASEPTVLLDRTPLLDTENQ